MKIGIRLLIGKINKVSVVLKSILPMLVAANCLLAGGNAPDKSEQARNTVAILKAEELGVDSSTADIVAENFRRDGFETKLLSAADICDSSRLNASEYFLYVVPNAKRYPQGAGAAFLKYIKDGGNLMVLGRPPFNNTLLQKDGKTTDVYAAREKIRERMDKADTGTVDLGPITIIGSLSNDSFYKKLNCDVPPNSGLPPIEAITDYKTYSLSNIAKLKMTRCQRDFGFDEIKLDKETTLYASYVRPEGKAFEIGYKWRWSPLIKAYDINGVDRGTVMWLLLNQSSQQYYPEGLKNASGRLIDNKVMWLMKKEGLKENDVSRWLKNNKENFETPYLEGSVFVVCAISDNSVLKSLTQKGVFTSAAKRIKEGLFLSRAGAQYFSYWPHEKVKLGAVVANNGTTQKNVEVLVRVCPKGSEKMVFEKKASINVSPRQYQSETLGEIATPLGDGRYTVTVELKNGGEVIDEISHDFTVLSDKKDNPNDFVTAKDGDFWLNGQKWYPVGINYWPQYAAGLEAEDHTYHWLASGMYNPEAVEQDLESLELLGANFLSMRANVQYDGRNLLDFLTRCRNHNIRVMLFLQSHIITDDTRFFQGVTMPFNFQDSVVEKFIRDNRLKDNATLFAYDLIWEPAAWVFGEPNRRRWDKDWAQWIVNRYGSVENAEADWGMKVPRLNGEITSPQSIQFEKDGPWRIMVSAYRRFMDNFMSRLWNDTVRKMKNIDPNHLLSFRQGNLPPQDFTLTATPKHVDFFSMEGYSFNSNIDVIGFTNRYLHYLTRGKPFIWIEYGDNVWDRITMRPHDRALAKEGELHEQIQRESLENGANGFSPWWWAGGLRVSEFTDYGIINPDGSSRPATEVFKKYAVLFKNVRTYPKSDTWVTVDRDSHAGSHWYIVFNEGAEAYKKAAAEGKKLGVRTSGTGTTSADTPLLAVGNTKYNGKNPPKYLDAEFNSFKIKVGDGDWVDVANGATVNVPADKPVLASVSVGNLQEAVWLPPSAAVKAGAVYLASTGNSKLDVMKAVNAQVPWQTDSDFGGNFILSKGIEKPTFVELQMKAEGRAWFGEKFRFTLVPQKN